MEFPNYLICVSFDKDSNLIQSVRFFGGTVPSDCAKHKRKVCDLPFVFGGGRGIRTPVGLPPNGFQDFLRNPTLTQNNRKYQTIENAENPVKSRAFGVLSFRKSKTPSGARFSASKTISKNFLEKVLDKSAPISPVASHNL